MNKRIGIGILVIIVLAIVCYLIYHQSHKDTMQTDTTAQTGTTATTTPSVETPTPSTVAPATGSAAAAAAAKKTAYENALKKYGSNRMQFDKDCQTTPDASTYKAGTDVMFDNRAAVARSIVFNGKTYKIPAEDFVVVKMTATTYPAIAYVDCDKLQNVAKITIQK